MLPALLQRPQPQLFDLHSTVRTGNFAHHHSRQTTVAFFDIMLTLLCRAQPFNLEIAKVWFPANCIFVGMLWTSFLPLQLLTVGMVSVLKNITNLFTIAGDIALYGKTYGTGTCATLNPATTMQSTVHEARRRSLCRWSLAAPLRCGVSRVSSRSVILTQAELRRHRAVHRILRLCPGLEQSQSWMRLISAQAMVTHASSRL